ncbi:A disintegrin and metalloproteinase with thrombospondin motifs 16 [Liparis tanakae]|uniref:A disintegrin and metalloproteinase with thrombospondin motifs 16 n=1 Tax=Liparis tanakae TaxID=230148 RepID=A0A4Z2IPP0_9TELE|nr:A disintegrin and metalloproteinase with thrombospondin motifs 16 [Liparis tanakae]
MNLKYPFPKRRFLPLNCLLSLLACSDYISIQCFTLSKLCKHLIIFCFCIFLSSSSFIFHPEYEIVSPFEVNHEGVYISHEVAHDQRRRRRRSLAGSSETDSGSETLHFRLSGLGQDFHIELREASESLIAPGFTVQVLGKNGTKSLRAYHWDDLCFYQGSLRSKVNSSVALSTCTGMSGLIRTQDADYFLRPVSHHLAQRRNFTAPSSHQPHILYKSERDARGHDPRVLQKRSPDSTRPDSLHRHFVTKRSTNSRADPTASSAAGEDQRVSISHADRMEHHDNDHKHGEKQRQHFCGRRKKYMPKPPEEDAFILPDEYKFIPRNKRAAPMKHQANQKLNVETLVVVDRKMMDNHGHENITTYVLTVLNMVSSLFKDGTIGGNINIVIVGLVLLDEEQVSVSKPVSVVRLNPRYFQIPSRYSNSHTVTAF